MKVSSLIALSELDFVAELDQIKAEIDAHRPLPKEMEDRIMQKLRLDWNYHSNAIEGNQLDYGETVAFLMHGITAKGKTLKDHLDIKGHNEAIQLLLSIVKDERGFSEADIRTLHKMILVEPYETNAVTAEGLPTKKQILLGEYKKMPNSVKTRTGEMHYYASPEETPIKMAELMEWYNEAKNNLAVHPLVLAAVFHHEFVAIHPFDDGNGRMARILMNLILLQKNFPVIVVKKDDRNGYYGVLSQADNGLYLPLVQYMSDLLKHSLSIYLKGVRGEDIEEKDDIDKEIALFKQSLKGEVNVKVLKSYESIKIVTENVIHPLIDYFISKLNMLNDLFFVQKMNLKVKGFDKSVSIPYIDSTTLNLFVATYRHLGTIRSLEITYSCLDFKNLENKFDIVSTIYISFEDKFLKISNNQNIEQSLIINDLASAFKINNKMLNIHVISKLYHETWQPNEMESFVNDIIKDAMAEIREKISKSS